MIRNYTKLAPFNTKGVTQFLEIITLFTCFDGSTAQRRNGAMAQRYNAYKPIITHIVNCNNLF